MENSPKVVISNWYGGLAGVPLVKAFNTIFATNQAVPSRDVDGFVFASAADDRELWPALKVFFARDDVEAAVR